MTRTLKVLPRITEEAWEAHCAAEDEALVRSTGKGGTKFIGRGPLDEDWARIVDALAERDYIARGDQATAAKAEWIKNVRCPACGSSSFFLRRDKTTKFTQGTIRYQCAHKCGGAILRALDIEGAPMRELPAVTTLTPTVRPALDVEPITLEQAHEVFARWLGAEYDLDALDAMLATAAVERLDGDPLWLLIVSGSGNAKTETVQALDGIAATITSTISSPGALLSATSKRERTSDATGGLLRKIGDRGVLVVKDVTSILSMNRDMRAEVLGAVREVYDGRWSRNVGTDGGKTLDWTGRIVLVGAVTTAWDRAHDVIASMGDRFVLLRMDSSEGRQAAGRKAIGNTGHEVVMRAELAAAVAGVITGMNVEPVELTEAEAEAVLSAADLVTLARTGVEYDYRGDVIDAHAPEMPTRFAKQLAQIIRGAAAIGIERPDALRLAIRCARDSMPPLRLAIVDDLAANPDSTTAEVRKRLGKPRATVDRQLQALHMLGVLACDEIETEWAGKPATRWSYRLAEGIDPDALSVEISTRKVSTHPHTPREEGTSASEVSLPPDISGTDSPLALFVARPSREPDPPPPCVGCGDQLTADRARVNTRCVACWDALRASQPKEKTADARL